MPHDQGIVASGFLLPEKNRKERKNLENATERGGRQNLSLGAGPDQACLLEQLGAGNERNRMTTECPSEGGAQSPQATSPPSGQVTTVYCHTPGLPSIDISVNGIILIQFYSFYFNVNTELSQFILSVSVIQLISWIQQICLKQEELKNL